MSKHTEGPWIVATSNSWRRIVTQNRMQSVCEPIKQNDGHPDLYFRNGGAEGPDARLIAAAPDLLSALERLENSYRLLLAGVPVRDVSETLAEVDAAIAKALPVTTKDAEVSQ